jgi:hypothetical protein
VIALAYVFGAADVITRVDEIGTVDVIGADWRDGRRSRQSAQADVISASRRCRRQMRWSEQAKVVGTSRSDRRRPMWCTRRRENLKSY